MYYDFFSARLCLPTVVKALQGFGGGSGEVWIDNVGCRGSEQRLNDCTNTGVGNNNCNSKHNEDTGVICISGVATFYSPHTACLFSTYLMFLTSEHYPLLNSMVSIQMKRLYVISSRLCHWKTL